ncbi:MAG: hypothetical protein ETSY1_46135 (plasmid) [Candidatus Entotheonella factor]|uniref:Phytanoyl-CoA dioxygenase n=1 Tax=Entotheonella factor TaxID=1429438 RepID=W4M1H9_ENTF1|nr:MAG: hypothetical protein ETSY1_46135 [Candidatus Entotheonella factor]
MHTILSEEYLNEYYTDGYINTDIRLTDHLVQEMRLHYNSLEEMRNDYPQYFTKNEHQAYLGGKLTGILYNFIPGYAAKKLKKMYSDAYCKAVHAEQIFIEKIFEQLLEKNFHKFFKTKYIVASYDIYLNNDYKHLSFTDIHSDIPNFHHFYETENDLTIYLPLVDLTEENGGRLSILPEAKSNLKIPGNVLLKLYEEAFLGNKNNLDENGYIVPEKINENDYKAFTKNKTYWELLENYNINTELVAKYYMNDFVKHDWKAGNIVLFNNKTFHAAETWRNQQYNREIYMIRLLPIYDAKVRLKGIIHGKPFNRFLIDTEKGEFLRFDEPVDFSRIPEEDKLKLSGCYQPSVAARANV